MAIKVFNTRISISITMNGFSTITQKGQVTIPKAIRDSFNIKPSDKIYFEVKNDNIIARRLSSINEMRGIVKTNKILPKIEYKKAVKKAVLQKFRRKEITYFLILGALLLFVP